MEEAKHRILIVDDEESICEGLRFYLEADGHEVDVALSAEEALEKELSGFSLILLDIMMGEMDGMEFARVLRRQPSTRRVPIIFCTAKDTEDDMVSGLDVGADDFITKPYSARNLLARVRSLLRRCDELAAGASAEAPVAPPAALQFRRLTLDLEAKACSIGERAIKMPRKEFELLALLVANPGRVYSREEILRRLWPNEVIVVNRVVDVNITRLRSKLGSYGRHIVTRPGYGYGFFE